MRAPAMIVALLLACVASVARAQEKPPELEALKASVGVWDAEIEVWPQGLDEPSITFKGVETITAYGEHWIASDFDSVFGGDTMRVHSIVGYDLDKKQLVGHIIDHGPYAATMTGEYDAAAKTVSWTTRAKSIEGDPMVQHTTITQESADVRVLKLSMPTETEGKFAKCMQIRFERRE